MSIVVIGDALLDINHHCNVTRNAPEANIPIHNVYKVEYILGGAANVARNIKLLDTEVEFVSVIGDDETGRIATELLSDANIECRLLVDNTRKTTQKNRIIQGQNIVVRYDVETVRDISAEMETRILAHIQSKPNMRAVVFSDYGKGVLTKRLCESVIKYANECGVPVFVDPKPQHAVNYKGCFCFKSNLPEGQQITGKTHPYDIVAELKDKLQCTYAVLTCGADGMYVCDGDEPILHISNKYHVNVVDVTGSGDIVLAMLTHIYLSTNDIKKTCKIANYVAGKGTQVLGNYTLCPTDVTEYVDSIVCDCEEGAIQMIRKLHQDRCVVFTNGCFDIVHSAHIRLLQFCKKQGDVLVVGLNSDESVKRLKGQTRPINAIKERCDLLLNLGVVDYVIIFGEDTPSRVIRNLRPNKLVKGGDYTKDSVVGREYADEVILYEYKAGLSTSNVIRKISAQFD